MPVTCVIGLQWGDEAKGKLVDLLTDEHDIVVRYQGGSNAGHTVVTGGQTYKLSLIPSGILSPEVQCVVTGGVVLNPASILQEIDGLIARGIKVGSNLMLSDRAHVIFPWHIAEDAILDKSCSSGENIGTTMRGIGPCYRDKVGRSHAIRLGDLYRANFRAADRAHRRGQEHDRWPASPARPSTRRSTPPRSPPSTPATPSGCSPTSPTRRPICSTPSKPASGSCSKAPRGAARRRSRHVPVRHQQQQLGRRHLERLGRAGPLDQQGDRRREGLFDARRRRAVSDRAGQRDRPAPSRPGQRIRHRHAPPAALRLVRRRGRPLHGPAERRRRAGRDAARRAQRAAGDQDLHGLRDRRPPRDQFPQPRRRLAAGRSRSTRRCPAGRKKSPRFAKWPICRRRPAIIWTASAN